MLNFNFGILRCASEGFWPTDEPQGHWYQEKEHTSCPQTSQHAHLWPLLSFPSSSDSELCCCSCLCLTESYMIHLLLAWDLLVLDFHTHQCPVPFTLGMVSLHGSRLINVGMVCTSLLFHMWFACAAKFKVGPRGHLLCIFVLQSVLVWWGCHNRIP